MAIYTVHQTVGYLKGDVVVGSNVVTIELQPLLVVTVRARGGRDSAGLLGTCLQLIRYCEIPT